MRFACLRCDKYVAYLNINWLPPLSDIVAQRDNLRVVWDQNVGDKYVRPGWVMGCEHCEFGNPRRRHRLHLTKGEEAAHAEAVAWLKSRELEVS